MKQKRESFPQIDSGIKNLIGQLVKREKVLHTFDDLLDLVEEIEQFDRRVLISEITRMRRLEELKRRDRR